jgi:DUF1365 family protein
MKMRAGMDARVSLFPPPGDPASLFTGTVMHARLKPVAHRFSYSVFNLLIDLDRLDEAALRSVLFSVNRANLLSFQEKDHGGRDGGSLRRYVEQVLAPAGVDVTGGKVLLLCYPRLFNTVFNPLSVYFAYKASGELAAVIYEVRNTFGEQHSYVAPVQAGELTEAGLRQERLKLFYVSPFNGMAMRYLFRVKPPTNEIALRILEVDDKGPLLSATFNGTRKALTTLSLLAALWTAPLLTAKVVGGIHWEALRLWLKGMRLVPRPPAPARLSYGDLNLHSDERASRPILTGITSGAAHAAGLPPFGVSSSD